MSGPIYLSTYRERPSGPRPARTLAAWVPAGPGRGGGPPRDGPPFLGDTIHADRRERVGRVG